MDIEMQAVEPEVVLLSHTPYPTKTLWTAFKTCYSHELPQLLWGYWRTDEERLEYITRRLLTEHTSPLEHVSFTFAISGVSRVFTHQFVRHRVGVSISQQSGRYTDPTYTGKFEYVLPESMVGMLNTTAAFEESIEEALHGYEEARDRKIPLEDARMLLPNCQATNLMVTINLAALLHMADIRMCLATQWEFRHIVNLMRAEIVKVQPALGKLMAPKCMAHRRGACDEDVITYKNCKLSSVRPHKTGVSA